MHNLLTYRWGWKKFQSVRKSRASSELFQINVSIFDSPEMGLGFALAGRLVPGLGHAPWLMRQSPPPRDTSEAGRANDPLWTVRFPAGEWYFLTGELGRCSGEGQFPAGEMRHHPGKRVSPGCMPLLPTGECGLPKCRNTSNRGERRFPKGKIHSHPGTPSHLGLRSLKAKHAARPWPG